MRTFASGDSVCGREVPAAHVATPSVEREGDALFFRTGGSPRVATIALDVETLRLESEPVYLFLRTPWFGSRMLEIQDHPDRPLVGWVTTEAPITPPAGAESRHDLGAPLECAGQQVPVLFTDALGTISINAPWPSGVPAGFTFYMQYWLEDPGGVLGFAASNALATTTP